jgi:hypothetical protein
LVRLDQQSNAMCVLTDKTNLAQEEQSVASRTSVYPSRLRALRFVPYRRRTECTVSVRCHYRWVGQMGGVQRTKGQLLDTSTSHGRSVGRQAPRFEPRA